MARLPQPGGDDGQWGEILNDYLLQSLAADGSLKADTVGAAQLKSQSVTNAALVDGSIATSKLADGSVTNAKLQAAGQANGVATLDGSSKLPEGQVPSRLSSGQLSATITASPRQMLGSRTVFDGDSITLAGVTTNAGQQDRGDAWVSEFVRLSNGRINYLYNAGVGGQRLDDALSRFDSYVAPHSPETVVLSIGTNDISQGRTLAQYFTDLEAYHAKVSALGAQLVLGAIYPRSTSMTTVMDWNRAIAAWASTRGIILIPFWQLADPVTGAWPSGWSSDGVHPVSTTDAFPAIGLLAWNSTKDAWAPADIPTASYKGEGLFTNGFFTDVNAAMTATVTCTLASTTGSLAAGTYEYRVTLTNVWGKGSTVDTKSITLASIGGVTITRAASGTYTQWQVYRKGPGDTEFKFLASTASGTSTYTDNGSVTLGHAWQDGDFSVAPTGLLNGTSNIHETTLYGPLLQQVAGIRGNVLRLPRYIGTPAARSDYFLVTGITPGQILDFSAKLRGSRTAGARSYLYLRWRGAGGTTSTGQTILYRQAITEEWGLVYFRALVPASADSVRISIEGDATQEWTEVAEVYLGIAV